MVIQRAPAFLILFLFCAISASSVSAQTFPLQVANGQGSGTFATGKTAHVWADPPTPGQVFNGWTGDVKFLQDPYAWHTALVMPAAGVKLTAAYKPTAAFTPVQTTINGSTYFYYVPKPHVGVVLHFHGSGGSGDTFFNRTADSIFANELAAAGYAVISGDSVERQRKEWDITTTPGPSNLDVKNLNQILGDLTSQGLINANDPLFLHGVSDGGYFSTLICDYFHAKAQALFIAAGLDRVNDTNVPTFWGLMQNDGASGGGIGPDAVQTARTYYQNVSGRGVPSEFHILAPSPAYPERFARISGLSVSAAQAIYTSLRGAGFLDPNGLVTTDPYLPAVQSFLTQNYPDIPGAIADELENCFAEHSFYDELNSHAISFFNARLQLPTVPVPAASASPTVLAATFGGFKAAPDSIVSSFGLGLAGATEVQVRDNSGATLNAPLVSLTATQVNSLVPSTVVPGAATLTISASTIALLSGGLTIGAVSPGLFSVNGNGQGPPAANLLRVTAAGKASYEPVVTFDASLKRYVPAPINLGPAGDQLYLVLYGSGIRHAADPDSIVAQIGGYPVKPSYAGPQGIPGLDQINAQIPRVLAGSGVGDVMIAVDGEYSNSLQVLIQ